ncbi:hypothetical protein ACA910_018018 [Epithemia clementina (nom. ined.)]
MDAIDQSLTSQDSIDSKSHDSPSQNLIGWYIGLVIRATPPGDSADTTLTSTMSKCVYYYCRVPVEMDDLEKHLSAVGFDLESSDEWVLAQTMTEAFLESSCTARNVRVVPLAEEDQQHYSNTKKPVTSSQNSPSFAIYIPLRYQDFDIVANLRLKTTIWTADSTINPQVTPLTPAVLDYFRHNSKQSPTHKYEAGPEQTSVVQDDEIDFARMQALWENARLQHLQRMQQLVEKKKAEEGTKALALQARTSQNLIENTEINDKQSPTRTESNDSDDKPGLAAATAPATPSSAKPTSSADTPNSDSSRRRPPAPSHPVRKKPKMHYRVRGKKKPVTSRYAGSEET